MKSYPEQGVNPGTWRYVKVAKDSWSALFVCPRCGTIGYLFDHEIDKEGVVTPSVLCDCGFHEMIKLEGFSQAGPNAHFQD